MDNLEYVLLLTSSWVTIQEWSGAGVKTYETGECVGSELVRDVTSFNGLEELDELLPPDTKKYILKNCKKLKALKNV